MTTADRNGKAPRVSIGLPVFNGDKYIARSIESILAQTFRDFEFIISDNASQDGTEEICRSYADRDLRIRYTRSDINRGAAWNHNNTFRLASGQYFRWQNHDDICDPTLLEKCVAVLDREPSVVLCYSKFARIDAQGNPIDAQKHGWSAIASSAASGIATPYDRFRALIHRRDACEEIYGLMRADVVRQTRLLGSYSQSDDNFLAEMALRGEFREIAEPLFYYRLHAEQSTKAHPSRLERIAWFDPVAARRLNIPFVRQFREYVMLINRAPLPLSDRMHCYIATLGWAWRFRRWLRQDLREAIFIGRIVPFLKRRMPWTRPMWHAVKRIRT